MMREVTVGMVALGIRGGANVWCADFDPSPCVIWDAWVFHCALRCLLSIVICEMHMLGYGHVHSCYIMWNM